MSWWWMAFPAAGPAGLAGLALAIVRERARIECRNVAFRAQFAIRLGQLSRR